MKITCFKQGIGVEHLEITGVLEELSVQEIKDFGSLMDRDSAIRDRLLRRAPQERMFCMHVDESFDPILQGCSGSIVWQNGAPVGVFVAKFFVQNHPPLLFIEPLQDVFGSIIEEK